jgi:hypothetical protein
MKKIAIMVAIMIFAASGSVFAAGASLASDAVTSADGKQIFGGVDQADADRDAAVLLGKMSKGVYFRSNFGDQVTEIGFAAATYHNSGSKTYGTAFNSTAIYFKDIGDGAAADVWSLSNFDNSSFGAAWTSM